MEPTDPNFASDTLASSNSKKAYEKVSLDEVEAFSGKISSSETLYVDEVDKFSDRISPNEKRKTINVYIAGGLAYGLWTIFGLTILWHTFTISRINKEFWNATSEISEAEEKIDKSSALVNDAAKSLYAVIAPIAATVTGFYFTSSSSSAEDSSE